MFEQYNSTSDSSDLVSAIVVDDSGIEINFESIDFVGADGQASFYDGSIPELGIGSGILLTSGDGNPPTENNSGSFGLSQNGVTPDPQLQAVADGAFEDSGEVQDINSLGFNFTVTDPNVESVSFNLVFGSDEFPEFSDSSFVDVSAVFINDQNVGLFNNDPNQPLSIISENLELGNYQDNTNNIIPIEYDGVSSVLSIVAPVQQGENTIRFAIADTGDAIFDSGLFISNFASSGVDTGGDGSGVLLNAPGTEEADEIVGDETDQFIEGLGGNDTINPGSGNDIVDAGAGDDLIISGIGNNGIDGGEGSDTVAYEGDQAELTTTLADGSITVTGNTDSGEFSDTLNNIEIIQYGDENISTDTLQPSPPDIGIGSATIGGVKFEDLNRNGLRDTENIDGQETFVEPGLSGVSIYLDLNNNDLLDEGEPVQITDETGQYQFNELPAGTYTIREIVPEGFEQTFPIGSGTLVGDGFADEVIDFVDSGNGLLLGPHGGVAPDFNTSISNSDIGEISTDVVLGDDIDEVDFLVIPEGSSITVGFNDETITDQPGDDIFIAEFFPRDEQAEIFVSSDFTNFELLGIADGGTTTSLDLNNINFSEPVRAIKIVALNDGTGTPGFELANVQGLTESVASPDFYSTELAEGETVDNLDFGNVQSNNEDITGVDVYRFFRTDTQTQFYTTTDIERESVLANLPQYDLEGVSFVGAAAPEEGVDAFTGTSPVYRFFNTSTGIHLYTADENERAFVEENLDNYVAEGTPYYGYDTQVEGTVPLYRFYNPGLDAHFYTPSAEERDIFIESPDYQPEGGGDGIAFYVEPAPEI